MYKIVCINKSMPGKTFGEYEHLTVGKIYDVIDEKFDYNCYKIKDDNNKTLLYHISCFDTLSNCRNKKINIILND